MLKILYYLRQFGLTKIKPVQDLIRKLEIL